MQRATRRVVCGISGGVDSAVAALLLKKKGYDVVGLFMRNWDVADETGRCQGDADREDAASVCGHLNIPFCEVNFVKEYWNNVFTTMIKDYERGLTPNPDVLCNKYIKFDSFFRHAINNLGADAIATGHYARTSEGYRIHDVDPDKGVQLLTAVDSGKDQTLFLSQISQRALRKSLFPIGHLLKEEVKRIAVEAGMEKISKKKESMGICFIGTRNFSNFIEQYVEPKEGVFIDVESGNVVGTHKGSHYWTLGQRTLMGGLSKAYFVSEIHPDTQQIFVASGTDHPALFCESMSTEPPHWINRTPSSIGRFDAKFRYQHKHPLVDCDVSGAPSGGLCVRLHEPMRAISPGQFAIFYIEDECLGSAKIVKTGPSLYDLNQRERVPFSAPFT